MSNLVIIDDASSQIKYTGGLWTGGGTSLHYGHTATSSRVSGATMTFPFSGTSISVVGSFDANTSCTGSFSLDANLTTFVSPVLPAPLNHQSIWSSAPLTDGPHTLAYTVSSCSSSNTDLGYVWFDYILYTPSPNASTDGLVYFLDDNDPRISYSGDWTVEKDNAEDFGLGSHGGTQGCSFQLEFEGSSVSVHGRIGNDTQGIATQASFSLDSTPVVFSTPYQSTISYNQALFQSNVLAQGKHTLVGTPQSGTLWVDYLILRPNPSTDNVTTTSPRHSSANIGEIAGAVLGALLLVVGITFVVIFRRRLFKGRSATTPSRPLMRPPDIYVFDGREAVSSSASSHTPGQTENTYPPTLPSHNIRSAPRHPSDTPPVSPQSSSFTSPADSRTELISDTQISPSRPANSFASSSGHSRRAPSLNLGRGVDSDSVVDLKRRQQLAPPYDDSGSIGPSSRAPSRSSSVRPLPVIPTVATPRIGVSGSSHTFDDLDLPPVYTV
ncbi:hypothetical protein B0H15DRAFT_497727 [Mycena belliarum]|uniref:Transmembrane protein n=1 Tax=Mycena belliarum TaxID=1033014 RepID=A0AAD6TU86_9AGAR|nr:hypothetical protein B0H15DRAFT_497727 [Mycena belliae]